MYSHFAHLFEVGAENLGFLNKSLNLEDNLEFNSRD